MTASLTVRFVDSEQAIPATLWEACLPPPLEGRWWYAALEQSGLEEQFVFRYAVLCDGARPVGIAPFFLMDVPLDIVVPEVLLPLAKGLGHVFPALRHQRTLFVGSPCADEGSIGLLPEVDRREAFFVLQQALDREARRSGCPMLVWKDFPDAYAPDMHWLAARTGLFPMVSFPGTVAALPGPTMEDFFRRHERHAPTATQEKIARQQPRASPLTRRSSNIPTHPRWRRFLRCFGKRTSMPRRNSSVWTWRSSPR